MRDIRMLVFHARLFRHNTYFFQLLLTTTIGMVAMQALVARAPGAELSELGWLRAGMVGTWTLCAVAVGMLGYQNFQGTLVHLVRTPFAAARTLLPVVGAASVFGLAALPLAALVAWALGLPVALPHLGPFLLALLLFWLACLAVCSLVGIFFVLTPSAITYESLVSIPVVLLSGVFGTPPFIPAIVAASSYLLPTRLAVSILVQVTTGGGLPWPAVGAVLLLSLLWLAAAWWGTGVVSRRATITGKLELV